MKGTVTFLPAIRISRRASTSRLSSKAERNASLTRTRRKWNFNKPKRRQIRRQRRRRRRQAVLPLRPPSRPPVRPPTRPRLGGCPQCGPRHLFNFLWFLLWFLWSTLDAFQRGPLLGGRPKRGPRLEGHPQRGPQICDVAPTFWMPSIAAYNMDREKLTQGKGTCEKFFWKKNYCLRIAWNARIVNKKIFSI